MIEGFDTKELTKLEHELLDIAKRDMPRESKKFMNKQGRNLKKRTVAIARMNTDKKTGNYIRSIKKGRVYVKNGDLCVRTYSNAPHAHLIEYGHRQVVNQKEVGFVRGKYIFGDASGTYEPEFYADTQKFIDLIFDKGLS